MVKKKDFDTYSLSQNGKVFGWIKKDEYDKAVEWGKEQRRKLDRILCGQETIREKAERLAFEALEARKKHYVFVMGSLNNRTSLYYTDKLSSPDIEPTIFYKVGENYENTLQVVENVKFVRWATTFDI